MKWIGQHIYDQISRFRNSVYLEDISTGTIASGGNLGLDSNNKIVKAASTSHDEVTLAGTPDYITISGQEITRNAIDLAADVTGVLPNANLDADTAHLTTNQTFSGVKTFSDVLILDGDRNWGGEAGLLHLDSSTVTNTTTSASGTSAEYRTVNIEPMTVAATNASVTTTDAASLKIVSAPIAGTNMTITNQWALWVDSGNVRLDNGLKLDDVLLSGVQTSSESFANNDISIMTSAAIDDRINTKYAYTYMTFSASAVPTNSGSDPEWMFPNPNKGIYEEDWNSDSGITSTVLENSTAVGKNHAANSIPLPHTGVLVGFHAIGRNDDSNLSFKAGLFHSSGAGTGDGIDWGNTDVNNEFTLECVATADTSGGVSGSSSFKGPCKLVSNTVNKTIAAGDTILPAIMATADNATDEIFVTWTIILKIPLTT